MHLYFSFWLITKYKFYNIHYWLYYTCDFDNVDVNIFEFIIPFFWSMYYLYNTIGIDCVSIYWLNKLLIISVELLLNFNTLLVYTVSLLWLAMYYFSLISQSKNNSVWICTMSKKINIFYFKLIFWNPQIKQPAKRSESAKSPKKLNVIIYSIFQ